MATDGRQYVGRRVRVTAAWFEGIPDVKVADDFELITKIVKFKKETKKFNAKWVFIDHDGFDNLVELDELKKM